MTYFWNCPDDVGAEFIRWAACGIPVSGRSSEMLPGHHHGYRWGIKRFNQWQTGNDVISRSSHRNPTKTLENWVFLTFLCAMGWYEPLFWAMQFKTANKINGLSLFPMGWLWCYFMHAGFPGMIYRKLVAAFHGRCPTRSLSKSPSNSCPAKGNHLAITFCSLRNQTLWQPYPFNCQITEWACCRSHVERLTPKSNVTSI